MLMPSHDAYLQPCCLNLNFLLALPLLLLLLLPLLLLPCSAAAALQRRQPLRRLAVLRLQRQRLLQVARRRAAAP